MDIKVTRNVFTEESTLGEMTVGGVHECFTLEDRARQGPKIPGATAIPMGTYRVIIDHSNRFGRYMPHILDVPGFEGIRIHSGNVAADTEGCILLGTQKARDRIVDSRAAFAAFFAKLSAALANGEAVAITIAAA